MDFIIVECVGGGERIDRFFADDYGDSMWVYLLSWVAAD